MRIPTSEEMKEKIRAAEEEMPEMLAALDRVAEAAQEQTFSGWLRREVPKCRKSLPDIMDNAQISKHDFLNFLEGTSELTSSQIDRLVASMGLTLTSTKR
jgi:hypothetical protein